MRVTAERYLSLQEVGDELGISDQTVRRWVKAGELAAYKPGKEYRIKGSDLEEFLQTREVGPKGQAPLPLENGPAGPQRREDTYQPWLEFINRYADRWDEKITRGVIEPGAVDDLIDVLDAVSPILGELGLKEKREQPPGYPYTHGPLMEQAITRLLEEVLGGVIEACAKLEKTDELARLRHSKEELTDKRDQAASG